MPDVIIVGGGMAGLSAAYACGRNGLKPALIESRRRLGGLVGTELLDGCYLEAGPDSCLASKTSFVELASEIGIQEDELVYSDPASRTVYIAKHGRLEPLPGGMTWMVPGDLGAARRSPLFGLEAIASCERELRLPPRGRTEDCSVAAFVLDHFDGDLLENVAEPLLAGVYGGDVHRLSARSVLPTLVEYERSHGSLIEGVRHSAARARSGRGMFVTCRHGMQTVVDCLAEAIRPAVTVLSATATKVQRVEGAWVATCGSERVSAPQMILASPAHVAAELLQPVSSGLADALAAIPYTSAIIVTLGFRAGQCRHEMNGTGFLVPARERRTVAACTWVQRKWPSKVRGGLVVLRAFLVGDQAARLAGATDGELAGLVRADLERLMGVDGEPVFRAIYRWPNSMPQYVVGHEERVAALFRVLGQLPGLYLAGNAYQGIGLPDAIAMGRSVAREVIAQARNFRAQRTSILT